MVQLKFDFNKDLEKALKKYPSLSFIQYRGSPYVKGNFIVMDSKNKIDIETYEILISFPNNYPYQFPFVTEISGKIPKDVNRHVRINGTLCFGNWQDELNACKHGISLIWFLEEILNAHLCREYVRENTKRYPTGERSHDMEGNWEGYYDIFNTQDKIAILNELDLILYHKSIGRNAACYCNSGKKYKACHEKIEPKILNMGRKNAVSIFEALKNNYKEAK